MEAEIDCRKVGGNWSCNQFLSFGLSRSLVSGTQTAVAATAISLEEAIQSIEVEFLNPRLEVIEGYNIIIVPYRITNHHNLPHKVVVQISLPVQCYRVSGEITDLLGFSYYGGLSYSGDPDEKIHLVPAESTIEVEDKIYMLRPYYMLGSYWLDYWVEECNPLTIGTPRIEYENEYIQPGILILD